MTPDPSVLAKLREQKQEFFVPYYREIVARHPAGIQAVEVKSLVRTEILQKFGVDIFDPAHTGLNPSTGDSRGHQWANNLISNSVLDKYMLVVHGGRAMLYPGAIDNSQPIPHLGPLLRPGQVSQLNSREPTWIEVQSDRKWRRSPQLADYVKALSGHACAVAGPRCAVFDGRDERPYVEAHHLISMAMQSETPVNLDRSTNMVPVCPGCHVCLHRGAASHAGEVLDAVLGWFESVHHVTFEAANTDIDLDKTREGLLKIYGSVLSEDA